ncbi:hypothetical protein [Chitinimonas sp.]|uniref:hypothetical protein n=1 Tax=Chitinimonas sp. TaxID=1934313 RepID=UPI002F956875
MRPAPHPTLLACLLALTLGQTVLASGGYSDEQLVGTSRLQPEPAAMAGFVHGHLGVLWPSYDRRYLLLAYRQAKGLKPATDEELAGLLKPPAQDGGAPAGDAGPYGALNWISARKQAGLADAPYQIGSGVREQASYVYSENCQPGAFELAVKILAARQREHGKEGDWVKVWAQGQDAVFSACSKSNTQLPLPTLPANAPKWLKQDQAYQAAAMQFYQEKLTEAGAAFETLAKDTASPWHEWAGYLSVRSWWRANFTEPQDYAKLREQSPSWSEHPMAKRLKAVVADAKDKDVREAAQDLYDIFATRYDPKANHLALWRQMDGKEPVTDLDAWILSDRWLWAVLREADYADDWLFQARNATTADFKSGSSDPARKLIEGWQRTKEPIWLAGALMALPGNTAPDLSQQDIDTLVAASRQYKSEHPLYLHFAWQRARLALAHEDYKEARAELARVAPQLKDESLGTRQAFDQLNMLAAPDLATVARYLMRTSLGQEVTDMDSAQFTPGKPVPLLDQATRHWLLDNFSGQELLALARIETLPAAIREQLAGEAWRIGATLDDVALEQASYPVWAELSGAKIAAEERRFHLARGVLLKEFSRINQSDTGTPQQGYSWWQTSEQPGDYSWKTRPAFQDATQRAANEAARKRLRERNETEWMGQQILPWLGKQPKFDEGPAILEKLVWASRRGDKHTPTSRAAFQLLHKQYPKSPEALRTRYFF